MRRYLGMTGDPRTVVRDADALYFGGRVEEFSLVPLAGARQGSTDLAQWVQRAKASA